MWPTDGSFVALTQCDELVIRKWQKMPKRETWSKLKITVVRKLDWGTLGSVSWFQNTMTYTRTGNIWRRFINCFFFLQLYSLPIIFIKGYPIKLSNCAPSQRVTHIKFSYSSNRVFTPKKKHKTILILKRWLKKQNK